MVSSKSPSIKVEEKTKENLDSVKIHSNQSYSEVVNGLIITNKQESISEFWNNVKEELKKIKNKEKEKEN